MHNDVYLKDIIFKDNTKLVILNQNAINVAYKLKRNNDLKNLFIIGEMYHKYYDFCNQYKNDNSKVVFTKTNMIETSYEFNYVLDKEKVPDNIFICEDIIRYTPNFYHNLYGEFYKNRIKNIMLYTEMTNPEWLKESMLYNLNKISEKLNGMEFDVLETAYNDFVISKK